MSKLLLVEDNENLAFMIQTCLETDRHLVDMVASGDEALTLLKMHDYDLLILDWNLPDLSGLDICVKYRSMKGSAPVLMLTAKSGSQDKVLALDSGADDYLSKPFDPQELLARVRALLRRPRAVIAGNLTAAGIELDPMTLQLRFGEQQIELSLKECTLLELLMKNPNRSFSTDVIMHKLWPSDSEVSSDTVRSHIRNLRRKLNDQDGSIIKQVRGLGYSFCPPKNGA